MTQYELVESDSREGLQAGVQQKLAEGWTLQGGVAVYCWSESRESRDGPYAEPYARYVQAMVISGLEEWLYRRRQLRSLRAGDGHPK